MAKQWYYVDPNDEEVGPVDSQKIRQLVAKKIITRTTMVWRDDLPDWVEAGRIRKLFGDSTSIRSERPAATQRPQSTASEPADSDDDYDDWASLADGDPIPKDDPYAFQDESGQVFRSFERPAPKPVPKDDDWDDDNPYAVSAGRSKSKKRPKQQAVSGSDYANPLARLVARMIDGFIGLAAISVVWGIGFAVSPALLQNLGNNNEAAEAAVVGALLTVFALTFLISLGFYYIWIPMQNASVHQASWGKRVMGIIVTDLTGERVTTGQAFGREWIQIVFGMIPSGLVGLADNIWCLFDENKQCLHDKVASTLVLKRD